MKLGLNISGGERWLRVGVGFMLIVLAYSAWLAGTVAMLAYIIGAVAILTAAIGFCPANALLGRSGTADKA